MLVYKLARFEYRVTHSWLAFNSWKRWNVFKSFKCVKCCKGKTYIICKSWCSTLANIEHLTFETFTTIFQYFELLKCSAFSSVKLLQHQNIFAGTQLYIYKTYVCSLSEINALNHEDVSILNVKWWITLLYDNVGLEWM